MKKPTTPFRFGPGIVSGASDNDPTTVASLAVIGSTTIYGLAWLVLLIIPMLAVIQAIAGAIGAVTRRGLEDAVRLKFGRRWQYIPLIAILIVNLITLAADLEGGSAALSLLTGIPYTVFIVPFAAGVVALLIYGSYTAIENILKYVALVFLTYIGSAFFAHPDWHKVLLDSFIPHFRFTPAYVTGAVALLGTTLTAYAYVWETIEVAEQRPPVQRLGLVQADAALGMVFAGLSFYFIVVATGATLGVHHHTVESAQDAAAALVPLAGHFAALIFGTGLLASAILAVPVLAATCAYCMAEAFGWRASLDAKFVRAPKFYSTIIICVAIATALALAGVKPITLLFWASIAGGIGTPVTLAFMMLIARDRKLMGKHRIGVPLTFGGWAVTGIVVAACAAFFFQTITHAG